MPVPGTDEKLHGRVRSVDFRGVVCTAEHFSLFCLLDCYHETFVLIQRIADAYTITLTKELNPNLLIKGTRDCMY